MKYAAGVIPRVSKPGVIIDLATNAAVGCIAQVLTRPRASNASAGGTPAAPAFVAHRRSGPTDWVSTRIWVPCFVDPNSAGPISSGPISAGLDRSSARK